MSVTTLLEPGGSASGLLTYPSGNAFTNVTVDTTVKRNGYSSIACAGSGFFTQDNVVADAGSLVSAYVRFSSTTPASITSFMMSETSGNGSGRVGIGLNTNGTLHLCLKGGTAKDGTTVLAPNTWYRISIFFQVISTSSYSATVYINGVAEVSSSSATDGVLSGNGSSCMSFGANASSLDSFSSPDTSVTVWFSDIYADNRTTNTDCGNINVTAKRPFSAGATNGFSTQIGAGGSGYGSGHAPQVNERPGSVTNGWSAVVSGVAATEEYTIEGLSVGDADLTGATIVDYMGWIQAASTVSETASMVVNGVSSNVALTATTAGFTKAAGSTAYPSGNTAIGLITTTAAATVKLFECGINVAYIPGAVTTPPNLFFF